jgi:hypothetical protein
MSLIQSLRSALTSARAGLASKCIGLLAAGLLATSPALAGFIGHDVKAEYYFPDLSTVFLDSGPGVAGAGVEFSNIGGWSRQNVDFSGTNILLTYADGWGLAGHGSFDGWVFSDLTASDIVGVALASTNLPGLTADMLDFNGSQIFLNTLGLGSWGPNTFVSIDVQFADATAAVPEPASLGLACFALVLLAVVCRRRTGSCRPRR